MSDAKKKTRPVRQADLKTALEEWMRKRRKAGGGVDEDVKAVQIARRIVISHGGAPMLRRFIRMLEEGKPGTEIARKFGVTRQRANQWKDAIGTEKTSYEVRPLLRRLIIGIEAGRAA